MFKSLLQKLGLNKRSDEPEIVRIDVPHELIREKMQGLRDFRMKITERGEVSAFCKGCEADIFVAQDDMLIWFHCKSCNRYSFNPPGNVERDAAYAAQDGKPLEYEGFFIDFPPQLQPPDVFDSVLLRTTGS